MTSNVKKNLLLVAGSFFVALLIAEVALRILDPVRPADRVEFIVDQETYWRVLPDQADPRQPRVTVNTQGFRGTEDIGSRDTSRQRIFLLGDSYTWGSGINDNETYAAQLEALSDGRLDVINGGSPGWGMFQFQVRLERWIDELAPDVVVVFINTADILRQPYANEEQEREFLRRSTLRNNIRRISKIITVTVRLLERYRLQRQNRQVANAVPMNNVGGVRPELYERLLAEDTSRLSDMVELTRQEGASLVLVAWPQQIPTTDMFLAAMRAFADEHEIQYVDMTATLAEHDYDSYTLPMDHHPSALGHRLIAERLLAVLEN